MNEEEIKSAVEKALHNVAPDTRDTAIEPNVNFRDQFEIDSMDFVGFVLALEKELDTRVPEIDYPLLSSMEGCVRYFSSRSETVTS